MISNSGTAAFAVVALLGGLGARAAAEPCEGAPSSAKLVITVEGVRSARGLITASLYPNDPAQWLVKNGALKVWWVPATAPMSRLCIWLKSPGTYGLAVYQDLNSNHRLDMGSLGPKEPYGLSRNPRIFFAKPSLASTRFQAKAGTTSLDIRLNNPL